ncbi:G-type lectin S-receptor-like serine/threonine-protein kinase CES101 [Pyrus ussuriensis x Pyrus communis]|uniref:non-specific serine/threonine protein kinase n=1 Tax=Pyrus ussuriensis x Pyrus communis TaxID=2448454 RepID=A0A5N5I9N3_9ROSA|nr:G-type lectin S-receptor-like serine/threonine-protein kinase CES101 [Pyrus ussuriensis x Pyrus communis]
MATGSVIKYAIILVCFASLWTCHDAIDTLKPGDTLNSTSSLLSASGTFTLNFIEKAIRGSDNSFIAILRVKSGANKAWIANRDTPILSSSSPLLTLDSNNTLKITHQNGDPFVLFSAPQTNDPNTSVVATLLDSGNFVLQEVNSVSGSTIRVFWQSFDYPVDTFLPGMKLGVDHRNGYNWYNFSIVSNQDEDYLTYTSLDDPTDPEPEWVLYTRGALYEYGASVDIIQAQNCDGYNIVGGCVRRDRPSDCTGEVGDDFYQKKGYFNIVNSSASRPPNWPGTGSEDCKVTCWQNCDCLGFDFPSGSPTTGAGCRFWSVDCEFIEDSTANTTFVLPATQPPPPDSPPPGKIHATQKWFWIGISIAAALLVMGFCILGYRLRRTGFMVLAGKKATKIQRRLLSFIKATRPTDQAIILNPDLHAFTHESVLAATGNFSEANKLGQGGFGTVYKGKLATGQEVAVKRLSKFSGQGTEEFKNELILIYQLQHTNLVQLFGFCIHEEERMLIYEYMPNKSLDYFLFDCTRDRQLDWKKRFTIIEGITQGMVYLHEYSRKKVIHRDLKAGNILLDQNMKPKISDFGMAKIFTEELGANTMRIVGTRGYMPPEYVMGGNFSVKSDVYSYGVLLLEIISGRKNNSFCNEDRAHNLVGHAWELWKAGRGEELRDPTLVIETSIRATGLMINSIFLIIFACLCSCHDARDTLKPGDTLNSSSLLVSASGKFSLGFYVYNNTSYLAVQGSNQGLNRAWIGNRDTPIPYASSPVLTLDTNNTLKITYQGGDPIVLYSPTSSTSSVAATILDSGNFVLQEVSSVNGSINGVLWQSFDHPTDTFIPGMKLGVDLTNGKNWSLLSWATSYNPAPGLFSLDWDPREHELRIKQGGVVYWTSGVFEDGKFKFILPGVSKQKYNFSIVSNANEDYLTYTAVGDPSDLAPEWVLYGRGTLYEYGAKVDIAEAQNCDGYNMVGGCVRRPRNCTAKLGDEFVDRSGHFNISHSSNTSEPPHWFGTGTEDCKATCWQNCECIGFDLPYGNQTTGAGCRFWRVGTQFIDDPIGFTPARSGFVLSGSTPGKPQKNGKSRRKWLWISIAIAAALLVMVFCILTYLRTRKIFSGGIQNQSFSIMGKHDLSVFTYETVLAATSNFSEENKLGQGGFGPVYKGKLVTGREIAVKRLSKSSGQGNSEFKNELILIHELQHTNLVQLFGFCIHEDERMLIYEYMPNKSLDYFIFDSIRGMLLDWKKRFSIIEGITQGLLYLHKYSRTRVIHRDLKASNILLDENMNPKIADFGLARIFTHTDLEANTSRIVGTLGYMPPETIEGIVSVKTDVYSFGVLILEIISGRKNNRSCNDDGLLNLVGYAWELWKENAALELMDPTLGDSCNGNQLLRCIHVSLLCVDETAADRPTMSDVISMLTNESMELPEPKKPAYYAQGNVDFTGIRETGEQTGSINVLSHSDIGGR